MSDDTLGARVRISERVFDFETKTPIETTLDTWQAATDGLYENQEEAQPDYNPRGRYRTDKNGSFELVALIPTAYPVPNDGPIGELLRAAKRPSKETGSHPLYRVSAGIGDPHHPGFCER
jgi:catechol 1,2-dioxygenase